MSSGLIIRSAFALLEAKCSVAWSVKKVFFEAPRTPVSPSDLPYAVVQWQPVEIAFDGVGTKQSVEQSYSFTILGRFAWPKFANRVIALEKADRADEMIAQLQSDTEFGELGYLPLVTQVNPREDDDAYEGTYEIELTFTFRALADFN